MKQIIYLVLSLVALSGFAQNKHSMSDNYSFYVHEYEQELVSKLLTMNVYKITTYEQNFEYYNSDVEFVKSIRYFDSNGKDSLTIYKAINGSVLNRFTFNYSDNKISKILINDNEDSISYKHLSNKIYVDSTLIEFDSKKRVIRETSEEGPTNFVYNDKERTKKTLYSEPSEDYGAYNEISYFEFDNGLISKIKTVKIKTQRVESEIEIDYKFNRDLISEIIIHDNISNKTIRNVIKYR